MPFVPAANTASADVIYELDNQIVENTLYFGNAFAWTGSSILALANGLAEWCETWVLVRLSQDITLLRVETRDLSTQNSFIATATAAPGTIGGVAAESMSANVAPCVSFRTGVAGRSFRGRNYIPGIAVSDVTLNTVATLWASNIVDAYEALNSYVDPFGGYHAVLSRFSGVDSNGDPIPRSVGVTTRVLTYQFTDLIVDSQRRRLPGRGM